jgi:dUTP pyrophosphatase
MLNDRETMWVKKQAGNFKTLIKIKLLREGAVAPTFAQPGDAGADCYASLDNPVVIAVGDWTLIPLGFAVEIPPGYEMQIRARSGLALKYGIGLANGIGTIDSGFRSEVGAIIVNRGYSAFTVNPGDRICQAVIAAVPAVYYQTVDELSTSARGEGGFGSTGV